MELTFTKRLKDDTQVFSTPCVSLYIVSSEPVYIEMEGADTAMRAVWAYLVGRVDRRNISIDFDIPGIPSINVNEQKYIKISYGKRLIVMSKRFTMMHKEYFFDGTYEEPSKYFLDAMRKNVLTVPFLEEWKKDIWKMAIEKQLIIPITKFGDGPNAWAIKKDEIVSDYRGDQNRKDWHELIKKYIKEVING